VSSVLPVCNGARKKLFSMARGQRNMRDTIILRSN
jgi:hypothetical protein